MTEYLAFKQKTAYEISECDWSSDVCSSDLLDSENTLDAFLGKSQEGRKELVIEGMFNYAYRQGDRCV